MSNYFPDCTIPAKIIQIRNPIQEVIEKYRERKLPGRLLLTDYLSVKSRGDALSEALNPWVYNYKGIEGLEVESGVTLHETAFVTAAMTLKDEQPTDVINAVFYANNKRNDAAFEIGYLLPLLFNEGINEKNVLIINPSPDMIKLIESKSDTEKNYAVPDSTVAKLYKLQFPNSNFLSFDQIGTLSEIDIVLICNRDQKVEQFSTLMNGLKCCKNDSTVILFAPVAWFDKPSHNSKEIISDSGFSICHMLLVDSKVVMSSPRKKAVVILNKSHNTAFEVYTSNYNGQDKSFTVNKINRNIN